MSPTVKTLSILTWVLAMGKDISEIKTERTDSTDTAVENVRIAGKGVYDAAHAAVLAWPRTNIKKNVIKQISKNIQHLDSIGHVTSSHKRLEVIIAVMLAGVEDMLEQISNHRRRTVLIQLVDRLMALSAVVDPDGTQTAHYIRGDHAYQRWVES